MLIHILSGWVEDVEVPQMSEGKHLQCDVFSAILISLFQTLVISPALAGPAQPADAMVIESLNV